MDQVPVSYVQKQLDDLRADIRDDFRHLGQKLDEQVLDHARQLAKLTERADTHQRELEELRAHNRDTTKTQQAEVNTGRRWSVSTALAALAVLVSIVSAVVANLPG